MTASLDTLDLSRKRERMVEDQIERRGVTDGRVLAAMRRVPREAFVAEAQRDLAYEDSPLPIGSGQTISQPYIVALMAEAARIGPGSRVLEIGTGSGYAAAVLSLVAAEVYTIERHQSLAEEARRRLHDLGHDNVQVRCGDGSEGWPEAAPFDAILVTAAAPTLPEPLLQQLAEGGRLVIPLGAPWRVQSLMRVTRTGEAEFEEEDLGAVSFVPLVAPGDGVPSRGKRPGRQHGGTADRLHAAEIRSVASFEALAAEWQELWHRCPDATPFQSPHWLVPWWRHYGEGQLLTFSLRQGQRLVALAPFYIHGEAPARRLMWIGTGNSDRLDLLCEPACGSTAARRVLNLMAKRGRDWDACVLRRLSARSPMLHAATELRGDIVDEEPCPVLPLPTTVSAAIWRDAERSRRRAARLGRVSFEHATARNFDEIFDALLRLHAGRWAARGEPGVLSGARDISFHRDAAARLLGEGLLRLHALRIGGAIVAVLHAFHAHRRTYYYIGGFDPDFERLSPGSQLIAQAIRHAMEEADLAFDFLAGREDYKYRWGARDEPIYQRRLLGAA
jgi:protein-L-isoaspartate(D-aspartate) O-methyltransferase